MTAGVRPFHRDDEGDVRRICLANGRLPERIRPEDWLFADYWTRYYTRFEPEHAWVAEAGGGVSGYLTAAFDTARYRRAVKRRILPRLLLKSALTGALAEARSRDFLLKRIALWNNPEPDPAGLLETYPGHLHVNLEEGARRNGAGARLMEACLDGARRAGVGGLHLETLAGNEGGLRFFGRMGFTEIARRHPFRVVDPAMKDVAVVLLARKV